MLYAGISTETRASKNVQRDPQSPLHDSTEFCVQCAIKFVQHEQENFRRKHLKNGRRRIREGKERGPPGYFVLVTPLTISLHAHVVPPVGEMINSLLGSHTYSMRAFCFGRRVCLSVVSLSRVRSR